MNTLDVLILIPALWAGVRGFRNGLVSEFFSLLAFVVAIWSVRFTPLLAQKMDAPVASLLAFVIIFLAALVITFLVGHFVGRVVKIVVPEFVDRLLGVCFGFLKVIMICGVLLYLFQAADSHGYILKAETVQDSVLYEYVEMATDFLVGCFHLNP